MIRKLKFTPVARWVVQLFLILLLAFTMLRLITFLCFKPAQLSLIEAIPSFVLGFRYDIRWICIVLTPLLLIGSIPSLSPFISGKTKRFWLIYLVTITSFILLFFGADFGHFDYVETRLNASALNFLEDFAISMKMLWQSYPLFWIFTALSVIVYSIYRLYKWTHLKLEVIHEENHYFKPLRTLWLTAFVFIGICGNNPAKPLKWSDAFQLGDNFKAYLALNPLQNFFTTLKFREPFADDGRARQHSNTIKQMMGMNIATSDLNFQRRVEFPLPAKKMNVVLVICESLSMYKSSMSGNKLNTTPYLQQLSNEGLFFNHCFSPHFGTARGVFNLLTGIPDVQLSKFSTRNERAINQHTIINDFNQHNKYYFIGGNSEFNNFKGILVNNIKGLKLYEEGMYKSKPFNVWGISDKNLFAESQSVLNKEQQPFFAIIQTADNHRPFVIPEEDKPFVDNRIFTDEELKKNGFSSQDEFAAFAYADYCIRKFMEDAKQQAWFNNTLFVFVGDHGVKGDAGDLYPSAWTNERLTDEHVPLLFYAPALIKPELRTEAVSQADVLPTIAGLLQQPYTNTTLGRDLLRKNSEDFAFIIHHDEAKIGIVNNEFYYILNMNLQRDTLVPVRFNSPVLSTEEYERTKLKMSAETIAFYETARWMLLNNQKQKVWKATP
ncbi:MAG: LTA synthase family protein [Chitinophagaceae bacterium]|jgi:phosphoglycerol transferase MdoB-like AlkP superfamily enzyme